MTTERDGLVLKRVLDELLCRRTPGCPWPDHATEPLCVNCAARELLQAQADALSAAQRLEGGVADIREAMRDYLIGTRAGSVEHSVTAHWSSKLAALLSERSPQQEEAARCYAHICGGDANNRAHCPACQAERSPRPATNEKDAG